MPLSVCVNITDYLLGLRAQAAIAAPVDARHVVPPSPARKQIRQLRPIPRAGRGAASAVGTESSSVSSAEKLYIDAYIHVP